MTRLTDAESEKMVAQHDQLVTEIQDLLLNLERARAMPERKAARCALSAVDVYLDAIDVNPALRTPLLTLLGALEDADDGIPNSITAPYEHPGGAPKTRKEAHDLAAGAAAITLLMRAGKKLDSACRDVALAMDRDGNAAVLKTYRKNLRRGKASQAAVAFHDLMLREALSRQHLTPRERADQALEFLRDKATKKA